jgi:hypothetical protein
MASADMAPEQVFDVPTLRYLSQTLGMTAMSYWSIGPTKSPRQVC